MERFFNFYAGKNDLNNALHKGQIVLTAVLPLMFLVLAVVTFVFFPLAALLIAAVVALYIAGICRSIYLFSRKDETAKPLLVSSLSGPVYLTLLLVLNPALVGFWGFALVLLLPLALLIPFISGIFKDDDELENDEDFDEDYED